MEEIRLQPIGEEHIDRLRLFDRSNYPVTYPETFYKTVHENPLARICLDGPRIVAAVTCRMDFIGCRKVLYVQTLAVTILYREKGLGSRLLDFVEEAARENSLDFIVLHVQTSNETAISFYRKRGYEIRETLPQYYKRIEPNSAHLMEKRLVP